MSLLHSITSSTTRAKKRLGRGYGSGKGGHTASRGTKGQRSRGSSKVPVWFEGGQLPMVRRLPMLRGKGRLQSLALEQTIQLSLLEKLPTDTFSIASLKEAGVIHRTTSSVKIVGTAKVVRKMVIDGLQVSKTVRTVIENAGGEIKSNK